MSIVRRICIAIAKHLPARVIMREEGGPYLLRYYLLGDVGGLRYFPEDQREPRWWQKALTWLPCVYLHRFAASDSDDWPHSHPWTATSLILAGGYRECRLLEEGGKRRFETRDVLPGDLNFIDGDTFHRVDLIEADCWSIIKIGKKVKTWGFKNPKTGEVVHWTKRSAMRAAEHEFKANAPGGKA